MYYIVFQWGICVLGELGADNYVSFFKFMKIEFFFLWRYTWHMFDTMVPGYAFTVNSMDYVQPILLGYSILRWMLASKSGITGR